MINVKKKGDRFEREIANKLSAWCGKTLRRAPLSGGWPEKKALGDIVCVDDPEGFPFVISVKWRKTWALEDLFLPKSPLMKWWAEVEEIARKNRKIPMLILKKNRRAPFLIMSEGDIMRIEMHSGVVAANAIYADLEGGIALYICKLDEFLEHVDGAGLIEFLSEKVEEE
ncbi:hypothetical protein DRH14_02535 [Candidatus Shapirobacteria bacterium]|nr:MAG: hypothetical protein DRH14_02535 [Candidatus Shapirobacteria bacterium]